MHPSSICFISSENKQKKMRRKKYERERERERESAGEKLPFTGFHPSGR
jgi:hypothetical protein